MAGGLPRVHNIKAGQTGNKLNIIPLSTPYPFQTHLDMKLSTIALFVNAAMALPGSLKATKQLTYDPNTSITIFTDSTCTLSKYLTPNQPLSFAYPIALSLGVLGGPLLNGLIGVRRSSPRWSITIVFTVDGFVASCRGRH